MDDIAKGEAQTREKVGVRVQPGGEITARARTHGGDNGRKAFRLDRTGVLDKNLALAEFVLHAPMEICKKSPACGDGAAPKDLAENGGQLVHTGFPGVREETREFLRETAVLEVQFAGH